jgi:hypothetical protein
MVHKFWKVFGLKVDRGVHTKEVAKVVSDAIDNFNNHIFYMIKAV